tara:strand:+ start:4307 stop:5656 length:1350 start_codon:yes stop_codon:yes gene_type:complete
LAVDRLPPQNIEAERSVLGSLLIDPDGFTKVSDLIDPDDFYRQSHRSIYEAIRLLGVRNEPADFVTVCDELERMEVLETVGGESYVSSLANDVPSAFNVEYYADIVKRASILRQVIVGAGDISSLALSSDADAATVLDNAEEIIFRIARKSESARYYSLREILTDYVDDMHFRHERPELLNGVPTGYNKLNELLGGYQRSDLIIVAARTGMGKTTFMLNVAWKAARQQDVPVALFTLEVSPVQLAQRLVSMEAQIDSSLLRDARLTDADFQKVGQAIGELSECPVFIDDTPALSILQLRAKCRRMHAQHNIGLIVVDYLQLMRTSGRTENRVQEISEITRSLKSIARELDVPVIAGAQLSRAIDARGDQKPRLSDLRESGSIEQDADIVMFLYADGGDVPHSGPLRMKVEVAKHRHGSVGELDVMFLRQQGLFLEAGARSNNDRSEPFN